MTRSAGLVLPLFSIRSDADAGIGDLSLLPRFAQWVAAAGHRRIQLLPVAEIPRGERSPYSAISAFAIDPVYIGLSAVEHLAPLPGVSSVSPSVQRQIDLARESPIIDFDRVRDLKLRALRQAFDAFEAKEIRGGSSRARLFERYCGEQSQWLADYAVYRASAEVRGHGRWSAWELGLRERRPDALAAVRATTERYCRFFSFVQWLADEQLTAARRAAHTAGVEIDGDLPFMVARESADVWQHPNLFEDAASLGAPPDAFNADGQDWQLPPWRFEGMSLEDFAWLRARGGNVAARFDGCRIDHVVGLFRQWVRRGGTAGFLPPDEATQVERGHHLLGLLQSSAPGLRWFAEDLGDVPDYVRTALRERAIPGYRVLRWEWDGHQPRDPRTFPACSVATWGTHDTSSLAVWWHQELDQAGRRQVAIAPGFEVVAASEMPVTDGLLHSLYAAGSDDVTVPLPDTYGGTERINEPGTVGPRNWGYRVPWRLEELERGSAKELADRLRTLCQHTGRLVS